jgi:hypothetical protein
MRPCALLRIVLIGLCLSTLAAVAHAQGFPLGILPPSAESDEPPWVGVWTDASSYEIGESVVIYLQVRHPAFVYLFDLQPDGRVVMLLPNSYTPNNYLLAGEHRLPNGSYRLEATPPAGIEELLAFATYTPLPLPVGTADEPFPLFALDPADAVNQLVAAFAAASADIVWSVAWTAIQITEPRYEPPPDPVTLPPVPSRQPPFPGSPGDLWYSIGNQWVRGMPVFGWYWYYGIEGRWHLCLALE